MSSPAALGVDIGSTTWKAVMIDAQGEILMQRLEPTDPLMDRQTERVFQEMHRDAGLETPLPIGATGYGRKRVQATRILTEITCHAKGAYHWMRKPGVLVDIGGQDTKVIRIGAGGEVSDFHMNDKCAAGTGRFLEVILSRLHVTFEEIAERVRSAEKSVPISSTCTVFAESEVVSLVAQGVPVNHIVKGLAQSLASRVAGLAGVLPPDSEVFMSGGVALNPAMVSALQDALRAPIRVLPKPQLAGALGAALSVLPR